MIYKVTFFLHCQGMDFPDKRDFGEVDAMSPEDAIQKILDASFLNATPSDREYIRGCLSARVVRPFPRSHAPRTDDVVLVRKADIPKMARILSDRACGDATKQYRDEYWGEYCKDYINDVRVMLGLPEE